MRRYWWMLAVVLVAVGVAACGSGDAGWRTTRSGTTTERLAWLEAEVAELRSAVYFAAYKCSRCKLWRERDDAKCMVWKAPDFNTVVKDAPEYASVQFVCPVCMAEIMATDPTLVRNAKQNGCLLSYEAWWEDIERNGIVIGESKEKHCAGCLEAK